MVTVNLIILTLTLIRGNCLIIFSLKGYASKNGQFKKEKLESASGFQVQVAVKLPAALQPLSSEVRIVKPVIGPMKSSN